MTILPIPSLSHPVLNLTKKSTCQASLGIKAVNNLHIYSCIWERGEKKILGGHFFIISKASDRKFSYIGGASKTWTAVMRLARLSIICSLQGRNSGDAWLDPKGHFVSKDLLPGRDPCHRLADDTTCEPAKQAALL